MWRSPVTKTPATGEPLSLIDAKEHLRVDHSEHDTLIQAATSGARAHVESYTGLRLCPQVVTVRCSEWSDLGRLPIAPVVEVVSISYEAVDRTSVTMPPEAYEARLEGLDPEVRALAGWPSRAAGSLITVELSVGYEQCPPELIAAIKLILGDHYAYREAGQVGSVSSQISMAAPVQALLANHRIHLL